MTSAVPAALRALLSGSVDYAGLFPPAGLALEPALENHASYVRGEDAWMLGCFVLPAAKLAEAGPLLAGRFDAVYPLRVSTLGVKSDSPAGFLSNLQADLKEMSRFYQACGEAVKMVQLEMPLPSEAAALPTILEEAAEWIETGMMGKLQAFWEVPFTEVLPAALHAVAENNTSPLDTSRPFGVKLRTGGTDAAAFPTTAQLAGALTAARDYGVALKFTAGLHHPLRHFDERLGTRMHGFLNVYAAGVLAREHGLDAAEVQAILEDERPENFCFGAGGMTWDDRRVTTAAITEHRRYITSFGSCSFDEPRDGLRRLRLLL